MEETIFDDESISVRVYTLRMQGEFSATFRLLFNGSEMKEMSRLIFLMYERSVLRRSEGITG